MKQKLLFKVWSTINKENGYSSKCAPAKVGENTEGINQIFSPYFYHIGNGNNGQMIKGLMNSRWWWRSYKREDIDTVNFLWTQWIKEEHVKKLPALDNNVSCPTVDRPNFDTNKSTELLLTDCNTVSNRYPIKHVLSDPQKLYNKIEGNECLADKKTLLENLKVYYEGLGKNVFDIVPLTFHIKDGLNDVEFRSFKDYFMNQEFE